MKGIRELSALFLSCLVSLKLFQNKKNHTNKCWQDLMPKMLTAFARLYQTHTGSCRSLISGMLKKKGSMEKG